MTPWIPSSVTLISSFRYDPPAAATSMLDMECPSSSSQPTSTTLSISFCVMPASSRAARVASKTMSFQLLPALAVIQLGHSGAKNSHALRHQPPLTSLAGKPHESMLSGICIIDARLFAIRSSRGMGTWRIFSQ
jgi:hypothetical protein